MLIEEMDFRISISIQQSSIRNDPQIRGGAEALPRRGENHLLAVESR
jgi:hypothetical protein